MSSGALIYKSYNWNKDPIFIFEAVSDLPYSFFLDSRVNFDNLGRFSFVGADPFLVFRSKDRDIHITEDSSIRNIHKDPFDTLDELLKDYQISFQNSKIPFSAGAVGYFGYDLGFLLEKIPQKSVDDLNLDDCFFGFYDMVLAVDHLENKLHIFSSGLPEKKPTLAKVLAQSRLKQLEDRLSNYYLADIKSWSAPDSSWCNFISNFSKQDYLKAVKKSLAHIARGDIYQVNLSQKFSTTVPSFDNIDIQLYKSLRQIFPTNFMAYLDCGDFKILSGSPERFLKLEGRFVQTRPMKGTRRRGRDTCEDRNLKKQLLNSAKDRAELLMIVDLERNDLGRVCEYGSIKVSKLRILESYNTVFQTTAIIEARLHKDRDKIDLIKACFPGGSITGCPKIRSMQIIEQLEPTRRGIYTGSLGYLGFNGNMDLNILIRTILLKNNKAYFSVGGGIVADSIPENEYEETLVKANALMGAINTIRKESLVSIS